MTLLTKFPSGSDYCAAWLTLPQTDGPHPVVVLVHGGGATHAMMLEQYERWFSAAGLAVLAFDFRHLGQSGGQPRQLLSLQRYFEDIDAALAFIRTRPELDPDRIALWGTSFGASHVVATAARRRDIAAAVIQCPILNGRTSTLQSGWRHLLRFIWPIISDGVRSLLGLERRYVQMVGRPGELAFVNRAGAYEGWHSVVPDGYEFDNRVVASTGLLKVLFYDAAAMAKRVQCPLLVCVSDQEELMDPAIAVKAAADAPRGEVKHYPAGHFGVYHAPLVQQLVADQIAFLTTHLKKRMPASLPGRRQAAIRAAQ